MDQTELLRKAVEAFDGAGVDYLLVGSGKHLRDVAGILKVSGADLDLAYVERWAAVKGVSDVWKAVLSRTKW